MVKVDKLAINSVIDTPIGIRRVKGFSVLAINKVNIELDNGTHEDALLCHGVRLDDDWLKKCGFTDEGQYYSKKSTPGFVVLKENDVVYIGTDEMGKTYFTFVHELQKDYLDSTGEELNVKL